MNKIKSAKILIVEDEEHISLPVCLALKEAGYTIDSAKDGREGFNKITDSFMTMNVYDLLIVDHNMPNMNGMELLRAIRKNRIYIPAISISAGMEKEIKDEMSHIGCEEFINKPFEIETLLNRVNNFFEFNNLKP